MVTNAEMLSHTFRRNRLTPFTLLPHSLRWRAQNAKKPPKSRDIRQWLTPASTSQSTDRPAVNRRADESDVNAARETRQTYPSELVSRLEAHRPDASAGMRARKRKASDMVTPPCEQPSPKQWMPAPDLEASGSSSGQSRLTQYSTRCCSQKLLRVKEVGGRTDLGFYHFGVESHQHLLRHPLILDETFRAGSGDWSYTLNSQTGEQYNRYCTASSWKVPGVTTFLLNEAKHRLPDLLDLSKDKFQFGGLHLLYDDHDQDTMQLHKHRDKVDEQIIVLVMVGSGENTFLIDEETTRVRYPLRRRGGDVVIMRRHVRRMNHMVSVRGSHNEQHSPGSLRLLFFFPSTQSLFCLSHGLQKPVCLISSHLISRSNISSKRM